MNSIAPVIIHENPEFSAYYEVKVFCPENGHDTEYVHISELDPLIYPDVRADYLKHAAQCWPLKGDALEQFEDDAWWMAKDEEAA